MDLSTFSELENAYINRYNYHTERLDQPNISVQSYKKIEKKVLYYDQKLLDLYEKAAHLIPNS